MQLIAEVDGAAPDFLGEVKKLARIVGGFVLIRWLVLGLGVGVQPALQDDMGTAPRG